jgi:Tol biopolymer transport system component
VAYVAAGSLQLVELSSGRDRVLVPEGEAPGVDMGPVSFSPDGRWIAFGPGLVVAAAGGRVCSPLGRPGPLDYASTYSWRWVPGRDVLIGETGRLIGTLTEATMTGQARRLPIQVEGTSWALDPSGRYVAYGYPPDPFSPGPEQIRVFDLATGSVRVVYQVPRNTPSPPLVAQWSPDGSWVLFWPDFDRSSSIAADGLPLMAVSTKTGKVVTVARVMLTDENFLTWCGQSLVAAVGGDRYVTDRKRVVLASAPLWRPQGLTVDASRSWYEPACSPDGRRVAVVSTRSGEEPVFDTWDRSLWLLSPGGQPPEKLLSTPGFSYGNPIWAADGRSVLVVRRQSKPTTTASICLASVGRPGTCQEIADLGRAGFGYYGIDTYALDWYQPRS